MTVKRNYAVDTSLTAQKVCQLVNNGKVNDLPLLTNYVELGTIGTTGISTVSSAFITAEPLDATHILVKCQASNSYLWVLVWTIDGNTITAGTALNVTNFATTYSDICVMDSTHAILAYKGVDGCLYCMTLTISGSTVTNTYVTGNLSTSTVQNIVITAATATYAVVNYLGGLNNYLYAIQITISGNTLTTGSISTLYASVATKISASPMSGGRVVTTFRNVNYYLCAIVQVTGSSLGSGSVATLTSGAITDSWGIVVPDNTHVLASYSLSSGYMYTVCMTTSGTTISNWSGYQVTSVISNDVSSGALDASSALYVYSNGSDTNLYAVILRITTGNTVVISPIVKINSVASYKPNVTIINSSFAMISYYNYSDNYIYNILLMVSVGSILSSGSPIKSNSRTSTYMRSLLTDPNHITLIYADYSGGNNTVSSFIVPVNYKSGKPIGVALDTAGTVVLKGLATGFTGLKPGSNYYYEADGSISINIADNYLGVAISDTTLYIPDYTID